MLTISHSLFHINCTMHTGEMKSISMAEGFNIDKDKQIKQLSYIYTSKPRIVLNERSSQHDGAIVFEIIESPEKKLNGRYWTERKTNGEIIILSLRSDAYATSIITINVFEIIRKRIILQIKFSIKLIIVVCSFF